MSEETFPENLDEKDVFVSTLNPDSAPFQPLVNVIKTIDENPPSSITPSDDLTNDLTNDQFHIVEDPKVDPQIEVKSGDCEPVLINEDNEKNLDEEQNEENKSYEIVSSNIEKIESVESDDSPSAVVPPDNVLEESNSNINEDNSSTVQSNNDEQQESEVPRQNSFVKSDQIQPNEEEPEVLNSPGFNSEENSSKTSEDPSTIVESNQPGNVESDEDYSISSTKFLAGKGPTIETNEQHEDSNEKTIDIEPEAEVKSFDSSKIDDVLGNKSLLKQTIEPGNKDSRPPRNSLATISYELFLVDTSTEETKFIERVSHLTFFLNEYDVLPSIDISVQLMDRNERALIDSDIRHCYGELGCPEKNIPPVSSTGSTYRMKIDLKLEDWTNPVDPLSLTVEQRIFWGDRKKANGNIAYRREEYSVALQCYRFALRFLDINESPVENNENDKQTLIDLYIQVENNRAQIFLITKQFDQCLNSIENVFQHQPNNVKALFRKSKALFQMGNYEETIESLKKLLQNPSPEIDREKVNEMLKISQSKLAQYHQNQKEICQRMFKASSTEPKSLNSQPNNKIEKQKKQKQKNENPSKNWWPYFALAGTALAAVGFAAMIRNR